MSETFHHLFPLLLLHSLKATGLFLKITIHHRNFSTALKIRSYLRSVLANALISSEFLRSLFFFSSAYLTSLVELAFILVKFSNVEPTSYSLSLFLSRFVYIFHPRNVFILWCIFNSKDSSVIPVNVSSLTCIYCKGRGLNLNMHVNLCVASRHKYITQMFNEGPWRRGPR